MIRVSRDILDDAIQKVMKAVSPYNLMPILSGIKVTAHSKGLTLISSNTSMMIQYELPLGEGELEIQDTGSIVVPAKYFSNIIKNFPSKFVILEISEPFLTTIRSDKAVYRLHSMDSTEFPEVSDIGTGITTSLKSSILRKVIRQVSFAVSSSENRPMLTGVFCRIEVDGHFRLLATDGVRLASTSVKTGGEQPNFSWSVIIPGKNLIELSKMHIDENEITEIVFSENRVVFKSKNMLLQSALIEGTFPFNDNNIPRAHTSEILVNTEELLTAIERVSFLTGEGHVIQLTATKNRIEINCRTAEIGDVREEVDIDYLKGEVVQIFFNCNFMRDILRSTESTKIKVKCLGKWNPIIIEPCDDEAAVYILTPVRAAV